MSRLLHTIRTSSPEDLTVFCEFRFEVASHRLGQ